MAYAATLEHEREMLRLFSTQAFGDADRIARVLPLARTMFVGAGSGPQQLGVSVAELRANQEFAGIMFALQAANSNRLTHLRGLRDETRELRRELEAEPALRQAP